MAACAAVASAERLLLSGGGGGAALARAAEALRAAAGAARGRGDAPAERRALSRLCTALLWRGDAAGARREAREAAARGVWADWRQRPPEYVAALRPAGPFPDPTQHGMHGVVAALAAVASASAPGALRREADGLLRAYGAAQPEGLVDAAAAEAARARWRHARLDALCAAPGGCEEFRATAPRMAVAAHALIAAAAEAGTPVVSYRLSELQLAPAAGAGAAPASARTLFIRPHVGPTNAHWTVHLGVRLPPERLASAELTVGGDTRTWTCEEATLFDDSYEHSVVLRARDACEPSEAVRRVVFDATLARPGAVALGVAAAPARSPFGDA